MTLTIIAAPIAFIKRSWFEIQEIFFSKFVVFVKKGYP